jgi:hypothetical protein
MSFPRFFQISCALVLIATSAAAKDAQVIIDSAARVYAGMQAYSAEVDSRVISFAFAPSAPSETPRYDVQSTQYRRLQLKVRRPYGYWLAAQSFQDGVGASEMEMRMPTPMGRSGMASWSVLSRSDNALPKQGVYLGGKFSVRDMPAEQFTAMVNSRLGYRSSEDMVLRHFQANQTPSEGTMLLGLMEPDIIGREAYNGRPSYRIVAKTSTGHPVMLWIDQENYLIVRSIVQRPGRAQSMMPGMAAGMASGGRQVSVVETLYKNQQIDPAFSSNEFVITMPPPAGQATPEQMGFIGVTELVKQAEIAPGADAGTAENDPAAGTGPAAPVPTPPVPAAPAVVGQALTYEQMSGIVLIDGDGGTATGFFTKIRDVDFVVTNQHVLVGNKKLTLKTLRGEEIPVLGIFGAAGCDIAILRIAKGQGELKLATDVLQSSKIGDKVAVVGNRRGGGVATQTTGVIKGVGPSLIEVDADFQPGNSGSPIMNLGTNEVIGVATYSETRRVEVESSAGRPTSRTATAPAESVVEKRWFGYRLDGALKWEAIDLAKLNAQSDRIAKFRDTSAALVAVIKFDFRTARQHPRLTSIIDSFETRYNAASTNSVVAAGEVKDLFRVIRTISEDGVRDLTSGDYYDYYRTSQYWENSITAQLEYRKAIVEVLKKYEANSSLYVSRMRNGS